MRIYITGSHAQGKSTLANHLAKKYSLTLLPEVARNLILEKNIKIEKLRANLELVSEFQTELLVRQIEQERNLQSFVSDRSLDALAYAAQHTQIVSELFNGELCQEYIKSLRQPDALLFFIRPQEDFIENDGIRENTTWESIVSIDGMLKMLLQLLKLRYFQINTSNLQERLDLVDAVVSLYQNSHLCPKGI